MKFLSQYPRRFALDCLHRFVNSELRVYLQKQVYMVWHDFHLDDLKVVFGRDGLYELLQSHIHTIYEYFSAILRTEYNVIFTGIYDVTV